MTFFTTMALTNVGRLQKNAGFYGSINGGGVNKTMKFGKNYLTTSVD